MYPWPAPFPPSGLAEYETEGRQGRLRKTDCVSADYVSETRGQTLFREIVSLLTAHAWKVKVKVSQSCPILCDPMDYTGHKILQVRILEWVAIPFSRGSSQPRDQTQVSHIVGRFFTSLDTREAQLPTLFIQLFWISVYIYFYHWDLYLLCFPFPN